MENEKLEWVKHRTPKHAWDRGNWGVSLWVSDHGYEELNQLIHVVLQLHRQGELCLWEGLDPSPSPHGFISGCRIPAVQHSSCAAFQLCLP